MPKWLYAVWTLALLLAIVLPVAVPYAIWPPRQGAQDDLVAECGSRAEGDAIRAYHRLASFLPLSSDVHSCSRDEAGVLIYSANVIARGPYGIPFATATVTARNISWHDRNGGAMFGLLALMLGAVAVSAPFGVVLLQRHFRAMLPAFVP